MASFAMTKDELATATLDAIKARAVELGSPLSDSDAAGLTKLMGGLELEDVAVTEEQFKKTIAKIGGLQSTEFDGMLMMSKMMGGAGIESMASSLAAAMSGGAATTEATTEAAGETKVTELSSEPSAEDKTPFEGPKGEWRMAVPRTIKIDELLRLLHVFKNYKNTRWPAKPEAVYVDKVVMAIRGCSSVIKKRQDAAVEAGVVEPLVQVLTGVHLEDRETCLRTVQCVLGICGKNESATEAFKEAGAGAALNAVKSKHKDSNSNDFEKAAAMFV